MIPNAWPVATVRKNQLVAGPYPGSLRMTEMLYRLDWLLEHGMRTLVNLQELTEGTKQGPFPDYGPHLQRLARRRGITVQVIRIPIPDMNTTDTARIRFAVQAIDAALSLGGVYVHCWGGHGRTGTVIGCWLRQHGYGPKAALERLAELRRGYVNPKKGPAPQTKAQVATVRRYRRRAA